MRVSAPVTDYIRASTMNTQGDLVVRGALVPERLTAGLVNTFFRGKGAGVIPAYENLGEALDTYLKAQGVGVDPIFEKLALRDTGVHIGNNNRNAGGDQVITGVGYESSVVFFLSRHSDTALLNISIGFDNGTVHHCIKIDKDGTEQTIRTDYSIFITKDVGNYIYGLISDIGGNGFTITWTIVGAITADFSYLCLP